MVTFNLPLSLNANHTTGSTTSLCSIGVGGTVEAKMYSFDITVLTSVTASDGSATQTMPKAYGFIPVIVSGKPGAAIPIVYIGA